MEARVKAVGAPDLHYMFRESVRPSGALAGGQSCSYAVPLACGRGSLE